MIDILAFLVRNIVLIATLVGLGLIIAVLWMSRKTVAGTTPPTPTATSKTSRTTKGVPVKKTGDKTLLYRSVELDIFSSFFLFVGTCWLLAVILGLLTNIVFGGGGAYLFLLTGIGLSAWVLLRGQVRNDETEKSVIAVFDTMTSLVSGPGLTFGPPAPIGSQVRKASTERQFVSASVAEKNLFDEVKTRDGATVSVGGNWEYVIINVRQYAQYGRDEHPKAVRALIDRVIRLIALYFDSDENHSKHPESSLANQKLGISKFFLGQEGDDFKGIDESDPTTTSDDAPKNKKIPNDVAEQCQLLGITFTRVNMTDILEPQVVRDARARSAQELAEREQETRDVDTLHETIYRLMWGGADLEKIMKGRKCTIAEAAEHLERSGRRPVMTAEAAAVAARTARGDATQIIADGDFTRAQVLSNMNNARNQST